MFQSFKPQKMYTFCLLVLAFKKNILDIFNGLSKILKEKLTRNYDISVLFMLISEITLL